MRVLIAGGGVGGLTAAVALRRAGIDVSVFEQAEALREVGAGLALAPNAMKALRRLDLEQAAREAGSVLRVSELRRADGRVLARFDADALSRRVGAPVVGIHRADLIRILEEPLGDADVHLGARVAAWSALGDTVSVRLESGDEYAGDLLVGADGIRSTVREALPEGMPLRYSGYTAWRGIATLPPESGVAHLSCETWGCGKRFGYVDIGRGRVYWWATANCPPGRSDAADDPIPMLLEHFDAWHSPIPSLLRHTAAAAALKNDVYDRPPARRWGEGRVTLLGDAAHPMTPNLGQGACQAIEDAVALARCLKDAVDVPEALRCYERLRIPRTSALVRASWRFGMIGQLKAPWACALRDALVRATPVRLASASTERLMSYEA